MTQAEINYNAGASHRFEIQKEINEHKVSIDKTVFAKTDAEKAHLATVKNSFKYNGLFEWNERNRPGNNKKNCLKFC